MGGGDGMAGIVGSDGMVGSDGSDASGGGDGSDDSDCRSDVCIDGSDAHDAAMEGMDGSGGSSDGSDGPTVARSPEEGGALVAETFCGCRTLMPSPPWLLLKR